jgi:hypothetical protein
LATAIRGTAHFPITLQDFRNAADYFGAPFPTEAPAGSTNTICWSEYSAVNLASSSISKAYGLPPG